MSIRHICGVPRKARRGIRLLGAKVRGCGCFELNSGPLEEQRALLKSERLLHLPESIRKFSESTKEGTLISK